MRRTPVIALMLVIGGLLAGCASMLSTPADDIPPGVGGRAVWWCSSRIAWRC